MGSVSLSGNLRVTHLNSICAAGSIALIWNRPLVLISVSVVRVRSCVPIEVMLNISPRLLRFRSADLLSAWLRPTAFW
jgi:hypothetical protein